MEPRYKLGKKGSMIVTVVFILILLFVLFGGKGTSTIGMSVYAATLDKDNPGSVKIFDIGVRSKAAVIRHEDGTLSGLAFRKIPLLDRWKLTNESMTYDPDQEKNVWISVDDGFAKYFVITNGENLSIESKYDWYGTYARMLSDTAFALLLMIFFEVAKRLWKRRKQKKAFNSIEG
jgi:hypothetical protein